MYMSYPVMSLAKREGVKVLQTDVAGWQWGILGVLFGRATQPPPNSFDNVSYHVLLFSFVALEMGFLKDGKAPDPYLPSPHCPPPP